MSEAGEPRGEGPGTPPSTRNRWAARLALAAVLTLAMLIVTAAGLRGLALVGISLAALAAVVLAAAWWFASRTGVARAAAALLAGVAVATIAATYMRHGLLWVVVTGAALAAAAAGAARVALTPPLPGPPPTGHEAPPPRHPFMIMNPRSGGGKVTRFALDRRARRLGATVVLLGEPGTEDVAALARRALADGADLLGVAGGDGTQALVAAVAAEHDVPFVVVPAGTRNHFALDLGLDLSDPVLALQALADGVEVTVDLGLVGDRTFVNNASFGAYAAVVSEPAYRADKAGTTLAVLPELLRSPRTPALRAALGPVTLIGAQAILVSNNPYAIDDLGGLARRTALDDGVLGVVSVTVGGALDAAGLVRGWASPSLWRGTATEVVVDADTASLPVGVDGESLAMPTPVRCTIRPGALRVRVPRDRPGPRPPRPALDWTRLVLLALPAGRTGRRGTSAPARSGSGTGTPDGSGAR